MFEFDKLKQSIFRKVSWSKLVSREKEDDLIRYTEEKGVEGLPEVLASCRGKIKKLSGVPCPRLIDDFDLKEDNCLCFMIMPEYKPFFALDDAESARAFKEIMKTHHDLYYKARILHRDISVTNLCADPNPLHCKDQRFGILLDLNRAIFFDEEYNHHPQFRTGTLPFMAIELTATSARKPPPPHRYDHDLESFYWVLVWCVAFDADNRLKIPWEQAKKQKMGLSYIFRAEDPDTLVEAKENFILSSERWVEHHQEAFNNHRKSLWFWSWTLWPVFQEKKLASGRKREVRIKKKPETVAQETEIVYEDFTNAFEGKVPETRDDIM